MLYDILEIKCQDTQKSFLNRIVCFGVHPISISYSKAFFFIDDQSTVP